MRWTPSAADVRDPVRLHRTVQRLSEQVASVQKQVTVRGLTDEELARIRDELQAGGRYPLAIYNLTGKQEEERDTEIPGEVRSLSMAKSGYGKFIAEWTDPIRGAKTLDDTAIQWADDAGFTTNLNTAKGWRKVNHLESTLPGATYYFRVAVHNQSGLTSHASVATVLGATGWGPWCAGVAASSGWPTNLQQYMNNTPPTNNPTAETPYVNSAYPDDTSTYVELYWTYLQGTNVADSFQLTITDGIAYHISKVPAYPNVVAGVADRYALVINRLPNFTGKTLTTTIAAQFTAKAGVVYAGTIVLANALSLTADSGAQLTPVIVDALDWAGGEVWFGTDQYRNNIPPTNGISAFTLSSTPGAIYANQCVFTLSNLAYTQGTNIATHLAILLKDSGGTITLIADHVVTLLNLAALPSSFIIPYSLNMHRSYTVALAAVALTKNGYSFNGTFAQYTMNLGSSYSYLYIVADGTKHIRIDPGTTKEIYLSKIVNLDDNLVMASTKTVDGRDVSVDGSTLDSHVGTATAHGVTGSVMGTNMTNTLAAAGIIDAKTNAAKFLVRYAGSGAYGNPPTSGPAMNDGEIVFAANSSDGGAVYQFYRDGANYFWWKAGGNF